MTLYNNYCPLTMYKGEVTEELNMDCGTEGSLILCGLLSFDHLVELGGNRYQPM